MFFFFNDTATTEIYTLSLHDALPIWQPADTLRSSFRRINTRFFRRSAKPLFLPKTGRVAQSKRARPSSLICSPARILRSEEHTSELQSPCNLVCRLLLEKKKIRRNPIAHRLAPFDSRVEARALAHSGSSLDARTLSLAQSLRSDHCAHPTPSWMSRNRPS